MQDGRLTEAHLGLRRMHVDVDFRGRHLEKEHHDWVDGGRNDIAIGLGQRMLHQAVANQASVHKNKDGVAIELLDLRPRYEAMQLDLAFYGLFRLFHLAASPWRRLWQPTTIEC